MEINTEFINHSKIINEGTTCYIMMHESDIICKLYKGAMKYIFQTGDYELEETETLNRLNYIVSKKSAINMTDIPSDLLTFNGKAVGIPLTYYKNSVSLKNFLNENEQEINIDLIKQKVLNIVDELIKNGIVPTDPHLENFLVCYNNDGTYEIKMIDVDDQYISIYPNNKRDVWYDSEVATCYRVIDLAFEEISNSKKR